jgi:hypothetical protein
MYYAPMLRVAPHRSLFLLLLVSACAASQDQDQVLAQRIKAMNVRREAEKNMAVSGGKDARLELGLSSGTGNWCPSVLAPAQVFAVVHTGGSVLRTTLRSMVNQGGILPREAVRLTTSTGAVGQEWILQTPTQPNELLSLLGKPLIINGQLAKHPEVTATLNVTASFDCDQAAEFPARPGRPGGVGSNRGEDGENGLDVLVSVGYLRPATGEKLVLVKAAPSAGPAAYFILATGRRLGISIRGGDGGSGGAGVYVPNVQMTGGLGGEGGNGGAAIIRFDPAHAELRGVVTIANQGGRGGPGGPSGQLAPAPAGRPGRPGPQPRFEGDKPEHMFADELESGIPLVRSAAGGQI